MPISKTAVPPTSVEDVVNAGIKEIHSQTEINFDDWMANPLVYPFEQAHQKLVVDGRTSYPLALGFSLSILGCLAVRAAEKKRGKALPWPFRIICGFFFHSYGAAAVLDILLGSDGAKSLQQDQITIVFLLSYLLVFHFPADFFYKLLHKKAARPIMFCMQCFATMDAVRVSLLCLERYGTTAVSAFWASFFWCVCPHLYGSAARSLIYQDSSSTTSDLPFKSWFLMLTHLAYYVMVLYPCRTKTRSPESCFTKNTDFFAILIYLNVALHMGTTLYAGRKHLPDAKGKRGRPRAGSVGPRGRSKTPKGAKK